MQDQNPLRAISFGQLESNRASGTLRVRSGEDRRSLSEGRTGRSHVPAMATTVLLGIVTVSSLALCQDIRILCSDVAREENCKTLLKYLAHKSEEVRACSSSQLAFLARDKNRNLKSLDRDPLLRALHDKSPQVRTKVAQVLTHLLGPEDHRATPVLIEALRDKSPEVRESVAGVMGSLGDHRATPVLIEALRDNYIAVSKSAAVSLGALGDQRAIKPLLSVLTDMDLCGVAGGSLRKLGWVPTTDEESVRLLLSSMRLSSMPLADFSAQQTTKELQGERWPLAKKMLLADLKSTDRHRTEYAIVCLVHIGREEVVPEIVRALNRVRDGRVVVACLNKWSPSDPHRGFEKFEQPAGSVVVEMPVASGVPGGGWVGGLPGSYGYRVLSKEDLEKDPWWPLRKAAGKWAEQRGLSVVRGTGGSQTPARRP